MRESNLSLMMRCGDLASDCLRLPCTDCD